MGHVGFTPGNDPRVTMVDGGRASGWSGQCSRSPGRAPGALGAVETVNGVSVW